MKVSPLARARQRANVYLPFFPLKSSGSGSPILQYANPNLTKTSELLQTPSSEHLNRDQSMQIR